MQTSEPPEKISHQLEARQVLQYLRQHLFTLYPNDGKELDRSVRELLVTYDLFPNDNRFRDLENDARQDLFDYESFYRELRNKLNDQEVLAKLIADYGEKQGLALAKKISDTLGKNFIFLLLEPALATKLDLFIKFCTVRSLTSPEGARQQFITELNRQKEITYRAISLTPDELVKIQKEGMQCGILKKKANPNKYRTKSLVGESFAGLKYLAESHLQSMTLSSSLISISVYPEMALRGAENAVRNKGDSGKQLYLFKLAINPYYIIRFGPHLQNTLTDRKGKYGKAVNGTWILPSKTISGNDPNVEMFVEWTLPAITIQDIQPLQLEDIPDVKFKKNQPIQIAWRRLRNFFEGK